MLYHNYNPEGSSNRNQRGHSIIHLGSLPFWASSWAWLLRRLDTNKTEIVENVFHTMDTFQKKIRTCHGHRTKSAFTVSTPCLESDRISTLDALTWVANRIPIKIASKLCIKRRHPFVLHTNCTLPVNGYDPHRREWPIQRRWRVHIDLNPIFLQVFDTKNPFWVKKVWLSWSVILWLRTMPLHSMSKIQPTLNGLEGILLKIM